MSVAYTLKPSLSFSIRANPKVIFNSQMLTKGTSVLFRTSRTISTTSKSCSNTSHYDVLGITPKANQRDIKSAYYKLSKVYHPDKSNDMESAKKFRDITEAYEVLGNIKLKKMYDKGLFVGRENVGPVEYKPEPEPTDPTLKFYKSRSHKNYAATIDGTTPIYNFDAWSKNHYADIFNKSQYEKKVQTRRRNIAYEMKHSGNHDFIVYFMMTLCGLFVYLALYGKDDYDIVKNENQKGKSS